VFDSVNKNEIELLPTCGPAVAARTKMHKQMTAPTSWEADSDMTKIVARPRQKKMKP